MIKSDAFHPTKTKPISDAPAQAPSQTQREYPYFADALGPVILGNNSLFRLGDQAGRGDAGGSE